MNSDIVHYEIPAKNAEKLSKFYANVFGWKFKDSGMKGMKYWLIRMSSSRPKGFLSSGGMYKKSKSERPVNYIGTPNIDSTIKKFVKAGGKITQKKVEIIGMGWSAKGIDPEGNIVGIFQATMQPSRRRN
ncbi:MAG: VOC family protein [Candidatus Micrarchaeota archaeon]|nr:VOC family protein [Candidatus Micrarchaeota archaeon]